jgi:hypothetical protein
MSPWESICCDIRGSVGRGVVLKKTNVSWANYSVSFRQCREAEGTVLDARVWYDKSARGSPSFVGGPFAAQLRLRSPLELLKWRESFFVLVAVELLLKRLADDETSSQGFQT